MAGIKGYEGLQNNAKVAFDGSESVAFNKDALVSITEVIPSYLRKIYQALSGKDLAFDKKAGTLVDSKEYLRALKDRKEAEIKMLENEIEMLKTGATSFLPGSLAATLNKKELAAKLKEYDT